MYHNCNNANVQTCEGLLRIPWWNNFHNLYLVLIVLYIFERTLKDVHENFDDLTQLLFLLCASVKQDVSE